MKKADVRSITVKKFRPTPSKNKVVERENILERNFSTKRVNEKWVGDITHINTLKHGWCYLASVMNLHTKKDSWLLFWTFNDNRTDYKSFKERLSYATTN